MLPLGAQHKYSLFPTPPKSISRNVSNTIVRLPDRIKSESSGGQSERRTTIISSTPCCPRCGRRVSSSLKKAVRFSPEKTWHTTLIANAFSSTSVDTLASTLYIPDRLSSTRPSRELISAGTISPSLSNDTCIEDCKFTDQSFPDGGTRAWLTVAGAFACIFTTVGWFSCNAVFQSYYESTLLPTSSRFELSWIASTSCRFKSLPNSTADKSRRAAK
jgi:hypothetical protein